MIRLDTLIFSLQLLLTNRRPAVPACTKCCVGNMGQWAGRSAVDHNVVFMWFTGLVINILSTRHQSLGQQIRVT